MRIQTRRIYINGKFSSLHKMIGELNVTSFQIPSGVAQAQLFLTNVEK